MKDLYVQLREALDHLGIGFPAVPGKDVPYLKRLFTEEQATIFLAMENRFQPVGEIAERLGRDPDELVPVLDEMSEKALVLSTAEILPDLKPTFYHPTPWLSGWGDWAAYYMDEETARLEHEYRLEAEFKGPGPNFLRNVFRTIPVYETIEARTNTVAHYDDARRILEQAGKISVADCYCDRLYKLRGETPFEPLERCFAFGAGAEFSVNKGFGRFVEVEEALEILKKCADAGLVHNTADLQIPLFICNCADRCGGNLSRKGVPWAFEQYEKTANFHTVVDAEACTGCEECAGLCWFDALSMNADGVAEIKPQICEGCGICVTHCPADALTLEEKPEAERYMPVASHPNMKSPAEYFVDLDRYKDIIGT
jgi:electron transport complex protein RnfB